MATTEVPRTEWKTFLDDYTKKHIGKKATAELYGQGIFASNEEAKALPFEGVTYEEKGSDSHAVRVMLGDSAKDHLTHEIPSPSQIWIRPFDEGDGEMLEIHGGDGQRLILKLRG